MAKLKKSDGEQFKQINLGRILGFEIPTAALPLAVLREAFTAQGIADKCPEAPGIGKRAFQRAMAWIGLRGENPDERLVDGAMRLPLDPMHGSDGNILRDTTTGRVRGHVVTVVELDADGKREAGLDDTRLAYGLHRGDRRAKDMALKQVVTHTPTGLAFSTDYLCDEIREAFQRYADNPTDADLRPVVVSMIANLRPLYVKGRTVQFIAAEHEQAIQGVCAILDAAGCSEVFAAAVQAGDTLTQESLVRAFLRQCSESLDKAESEIMSDAGDGDRAVRAKTYKRHEATLADVWAHAEYYTALLGLAQDEIKARVDGLRDAIAAGLAAVPATGAKSKGNGKPKQVRVCGKCQCKHTGGAAKFCANCGEALPPLVSVIDDSQASGEIIPAPMDAAKSDAADPLAQ